MSYTLLSYDPIQITLPLSAVPAKMIDEQIDRLLEPYCDFTEVEPRPISMGDYIVITTGNALFNGAPAPAFQMQQSAYHVGGKEMPPAFDANLIGMKPGENKHIQIDVKASSSDSQMSVLDIDVSIDAVLQRTTPETTDAFIAEHFAPANDMSSWRALVASQFKLTGKDKDDPVLLNTALSELATRLVEPVTTADLQEGQQDIEAARWTCAIDALADHLEIEVDDFQITLAMPGGDLPTKQENRKLLEDRGVGNQLKQFAVREQALDWLLSNAIVSYGNDTVH